MKSTPETLSMALELLEEVKRQLQESDELMASVLGVTVQTLQTVCAAKPGGDRAKTVALIEKASAILPSEDQYDDALALLAECRESVARLAPGVADDLLMQAIGGPSEVPPYIEAVVTELLARTDDLPQEHPLMVFAQECQIGAYMEHEVPGAATKAIRATKEWRK